MRAPAFPWGRTRARERIPGLARPMYRKGYQMPYENSDTKPDYNYRRPDETEVYRSTHGIEGIVSHVRLGDRWAAALRDGSGIYSTLGVFATREEARDALRRKGLWDGLPHA